MKLELVWALVAVFVGPHDVVYVSGFAFTFDSIAECITARDTRSDEPLVVLGKPLAGKWQYRCVTLGAADTLSVD